ncbi:MAG TPA: carbon storage regulator [Pirellulales bacterium]|nr:carbon storage regulator [Pirellulales bacterium]
MLVLSRKPGEKVLIADEITVSVLSVQGNRVRLGIEAPGEYRVLRAELTQWGETTKDRGVLQEVQPVAAACVGCGI